MAPSNKVIILTAAACGIFVGVILIIYGAVDYRRTVKKIVESDRVGVIIDAGGSGTRMIIYSYHKGSFKQLKYQKCERRGLTKYTDLELPLLKQTLQKCFKDGAAILPKNKTVPMYFAATAGMRLLELRDPKRYKNIWKVIRELVKLSDFKLAKTATITGFEEAKWAWVAANYLKGSLKNDSTFGIIELGSSSVQVSFEPQKANTKSSIKTLDIDGRQKSIYGHSYLCYGAYEMERRFTAKLVKDGNFTATLSNPCYFKGFNKSVTSEYLWAAPCSSGDYAKNYLGEELTGHTRRKFMIKGSGDFEQCFNRFKNLFDSKCTKTMTCGLNDEYQPQVHGKFLALGAFPHTALTLQISGSSGKDDFLKSAKKLCGRAWSERKDFDVAGVSKYTYQRCLAATYGYYLLDAGLKIDAKKWKVEFAKKINGMDVAWSLGLLYMNRDSMYPRMKEIMDMVNNPVLLGVVGLGVVLLLTGIVIAILKLTGRIGHTKHDFVASDEADAVPI